MPVKADRPLFFRVSTTESRKWMRHPVVARCVLISGSFLSRPICCVLICIFTLPLRNPFRQTVLSLLSMPFPYKIRRPGRNSGSFFFPGLCSHQVLGADWPVTFRMSPSLLCVVRADSGLQSPRALVTSSFTWGFSSFRGVCPIRIYRVSHSFLTSFFFST